MSKLEYKGYLGSAEVDLEDGLVVGRLLFMRDVISYCASGVKEIEAAFRDAVDDYLETCRTLNKEPDTPCKGSFNVRVGPERHRNVALAARKEDVSLNDFVCSAIDAALDPQKVVQHVHTHQIIPMTSGESRRFIATTTAPQPGAIWEGTHGFPQH